MENFGDRLSVDDIWRVVMFLKTIPNGTLEEHVLPLPKDYIGLAAARGAARLDQEPPAAGRERLLRAVRDHRPVPPGGQAGLPGLAPGDHIVVNGLETPLTLLNAAAGIRLIYQGLLDRAWSSTRARGDKLPGPDQPLVPPTVPGQQ